MKRMRKIVVSVVIIIVCFVAGVSFESYVQHQKSEVSSIRYGELSSYDSVGTTDMESNDSSKWVSSGSTYLETSSFDDAKSALELLINKSKASCMSMDLSSYEDGNEEQYREARMTIEVPSDNYETFMDKLQTLDGVTVVSSSIGGEDVSDAYDDTESQVVVYQKLVQRYEELLEQATTVSEIMEVETALVNAQSTLDSYTKRLEQMKDSVKTSTVYVVLTEKNEFEIFKANVSYKSRLVKELKTGFLDGMQFFANITFYLAAHWLVLLVSIVGVVFGYRAYHKKVCQKRVNGSNSAENVINDK